ncbi:cupin domain-containing protein [Aurantiacibacter poecillastricola]|uniref:cupin domain-containing protein n=1 Tax=Aurantiacibacter poecillastricola TaxID=3064385 RepID=UPI00273F72AB|nr:cupin domain-containing protein [Aurantiacibacter sp. 219JJ12-13]MDP5263488.1 cupin domain-containing protein [Aurantiacibacter sp. 219JJ12-13]
MNTAQNLIETLKLAEHPEGGWYRETWRAEAVDGERGSATAILFLLESGKRSHWHNVDATEIWLWHSGNPLALSLSDPTGVDLATVNLGGDIAAGERVQQVIRPDEWQAAEVLDGKHDYALVSCIVSPAFEFSGFTLAPPGWQPGE